jgi:alpha-tubulin suppressor-like RCC1 family protein
VSVGFTHALALDGAHHVWSWGDAEHGQLGVEGGARVDPVEVPIPLEGARGFVQVEARGHRSLALRADGAVFSWGEGKWGALGFSTKDDVLAPARVALTEPIVRLAAGERHTLALDRSGRVWAWGENLHGELGVALPKLRLEPAPVPGVLSPSAIAAGAYHNLVVSLSGALYTWGSGFRGQLGTGTPLDSTDLAEVGLPRDVVAVSAGRFFSLAVRNGGVVSGFGDDSECQVSGFAGGTDVLSPRTLIGLPPALAAIAGEYHAVVRTYQDGVLAWGNDSAGQLGRSDSALSHYDCDRAAPTEPRGFLVSAGASRTVISVPVE